MVSEARYPSGHFGPFACLLLSLFMESVPVVVFRVLLYVPQSEEGDKKRMQGGGDTKEAKESGEGPPHPIVLLVYK